VSVLREVGQGRYVGMESISCRPIILLPTSNTFSKQSNLKIVENETVISMSGFKRWDHLKEV